LCGNWAGTPFAGLAAADQVDVPPEPNEISSMAPQTRSPAFFATMVVAVFALAGIAKVLAWNLTVSVAAGG
jgi:hypothetical protein